MMPKRIHYKLDPEIGQRTACGMPLPYLLLSYSPAKVTCRRCKQSVLWQNEIRKEGIDARPPRRKP